MLSCSIWFSAPSFWMGGGLESRCVGRVCGADGAVRHGTIRTLVFLESLQYILHSGFFCTKVQHWYMSLFPEIEIVHLLSLCTF